MSEAIKSALLKLDPTNADHWTSDGAPKLDALKIEGLKRADIIKAAPHFTRGNPTIETLAELQEKVKVQKQAEEDAVKSDALAAALAKRDDAKEILAQAEAVQREAQQDVRKAMAVLDACEIEVTAIVGSRSSQHDIMDYIAASNARRLAKAEAEGKLK